MSYESQKPEDLMMQSWGDGYARAQRDEWKGISRRMDEAIEPYLDLLKRCAEEEGSKIAKELFQKIERDRLETIEEKEKKKLEEEEDVVWIVKTFEQALRPLQKIAYTTPPDLDLLKRCYEWKLDIARDFLRREHK